MLNIFFNPSQTRTLHFGEFKLHLEASSFLFNCRFRNFDECYSLRWSFWLITRICKKRRKLYICGHRGPPRSSIRVPKGRAMVILYACTWWIINNYKAINGTRLIRCGNFWFARARFRFRAGGLVKGVHSRMKSRLDGSFATTQTPQKIMRSQCCVHAARSKRKKGS